MIKVSGPRVLIKPKQVTEQFNRHVPEGLKKMNFVIETGADERRWFEATQEGTVVQIGDTCWKNPAFGFGIEGANWEPWCKIGDEVAFTQYSHKKIEDPQSKEVFFVVNDVDIQAVLGS